MSEIEGKRVLVVDDEEDVRDYLSMALEDAGFSVDTASGGEEALEMIQKDPPDLISLDLVMPKGSGAKLHHALKRDPKLEKIPVIIVTGHARDQHGKPDFDEMTMSGTGVYLEKPVKPASYVGVVCKLLGLKAPGEEVKDDATLRAELYKTLAEASPEDLKALQALKK